MRVKWPAPVPAPFRRLSRIKQTKSWEDSIGQEQEMKMSRGASKVNQANSCSGSIEQEQTIGSRLSLSGLPEEILLDILLFVRNSADQATFASCLLCCRTWYRICVPILYRDVLLLSGWSTVELADEAVRKSKMKLGQRVAAIALTLGTRAELVRSLTLRTGNCNIDWPKYRPLIRLNRRRSEKDHWFPNLCRILPQFVNLTTFSLKVGDSGQRVLWTPQGRITDLLDILPATVVNLELDTMGADFATRAPTAAPSHICTSLSKLIPRLRILRLRLRFLCEEIFDCLNDERKDSVTEISEPTTSSLQSAIFVFTPRMGTVGSQSSLLQTRLCGTFERPQHGEVFDQISRSCKDLCASGKLPKLQCFKLVDRTADDIDGIGYEVYDPVADNTRNVTWTTTFEEGALNIDEEDGDFVQNAYLGPSWDARDTYNVRLAKLAEGEGAWLDMSWRSRHPLRL